MTINGDTTLRQLAFEVCTALDRAGTTAVLSGGGAATLYAPEAIQSFDLDFIITMSAEGGHSLGRSKPSAITSTVTITSTPSPSSWSSSHRGRSLLETS